ncbi:peptidase S11 [Oxalobacteraceae bacterium OM1]|nr:peptidase S11 [Oxalobacteraceae bacterium OM1]
MLKKTLLAALMCCSFSAFALPFSSRHALVFEEETGKVLFEKDANAVVPIASLTKLMTAMVVLDAKQDMNETISIDESDVDTLKHSSSRVPVGVVLSRRTVLQLALMSSDNRAAAALARTYPGGRPAFVAAVREKLGTLGMHDTVIEEPTGLSPHNRSTANDLLKMATAASVYPEISQITTTGGELIDINGRPIEYRNTNRLVGKDGWDIQLSKTGFTSEAGRCLIMRMQAAGKHVIVVLLNAKESAARMVDAENVQRYVSGLPMLATRVVGPRPAAHRARSHGAKAVLAKHTVTKSRKKARTV